MKRLSTFILLTVLASGPGLAEIVDFDDLKTGAPPPGWTATQTGKGDAKWVVVADDSAPSKPNVLTFTDAGSVGIWTKADSVTLFDDFAAGASAARKAGNAAGK